MLRSLVEKEEAEVVAVAVKAVGGVADSRRATDAEVKTTQAYNT